MRKFFIYLALTTFVLYWGTTFLFVTPKNYITTSLFEKNDVLPYLIGQNWKLFVPPPKYNKKLYYTFYRKKDTTEIYTYEVLSELLKLKSEKAPFNASENILDYILSSSANNISWWMVNFEDNLENGQKRNMLRAKEQLSHKKRNFIKNTYCFQLLKRYSLFVAKMNNISINDYYISFSLYRVDFPEFADREKLMEKEFVFHEKLLFESKKFSIAP